MKDTTLTIVFGSIGAAIALVDILIAHLQLRGPPRAISDEEEVILLAMIADEELVGNTE
jgi:hypothetical protein